MSLYPLNKTYGPSILDFIERIKAYDGIKVISNSMSTQVFGDYDLVFDALKKEMRKSFEKDMTSIMVMKFINEDLS